MQTWFGRTNLFIISHNSPWILSFSITVLYVHWLMNQSQATPDTVSTHFHPPSLYFCFCSFGRYLTFKMRFDRQISLFHRCHLFKMQLSVQGSMSMIQWSSVCDLIYYYSLYFQDQRCKFGLMVALEERSGGQNPPLGTLNICGSDFRLFSVC